jgi:hypothetical protein
LVSVDALSTTPVAMSGIVNTGKVRSRGHPTRLITNPADALVVGSAPVGCGPST